jgi:hypothetical protein
MTHNRPAELVLFWVFQHPLEFYGRESGRQTVSVAECPLRQIAW